MCRQSPAYNTYATLPITNTLFMGFPCSTNVINNFCYIWRKIWMNTDTQRKLHGSVPMSDGEIEALMERIGSDNLRVAYGEMLDGCKRDPERGIWFLLSHPC